MNKKPGRKPKDRIKIAWLKSLNYSDYLITDHWQEIRRKALRRARNRCQLCNSISMLNVHHRTYERIGEELTRDVIVLCRDCHAKFHGKLAK